MPARSATAIVHRSLPSSATLRGSGLTPAGLGVINPQPAGADTTNATIDLTDDMMADAAQTFFASEWADAREEAGFSFAAGTEITEVCPDQDKEKLLDLVRP